MRKLMVNNKKILLSPLPLLVKLRIVTLDTKFLPINDVVSPVISNTQ